MKQSYGLGVGISTVVKIFRLFCVRKSWLTYHLMLQNTRNKDIYGLRVNISMIFKILGYFQFRNGIRMTPGVMCNVFWQKYYLWVWGRDFNHSLNMLENEVDGNYSTALPQHKTKFSKSYSGQQDTRDCKCQSFTTTTKKNPIQTENKKRKIMSIF